MGFYFGWVEISGKKYEISTNHHISSELVLELVLELVPELVLELVGCILKLKYLCHHFLETVRVKTSIQVIAWNLPFFNLQFGGIKVYHNMRYTKHWKIKEVV